MNDKTRCPICGAGHVTDHVEQVEAEYKGHKGRWLRTISCATRAGPTLPALQKCAPTSEP